MCQNICNVRPVLCWLACPAWPGSWPDHGELANTAQLYSAITELEFILFIFLLIIRCCCCTNTDLHCQKLAELNIIDNLFLTFSPARLLIKSSCSQPISHSSSRGGVSQITEKGSDTTPSLLVRQATLSDSGQYACHASVGSVANVTVHVIRSKSAALCGSANQQQLIEIGNLSSRCILMFVIKTFLGQTLKSLQPSENLSK